MHALSRRPFSLFRGENITFYSLKMMYGESPPRLVNKGIL